MHVVVMAARLRRLRRRTDHRPEGSCASSESGAHGGAGRRAGADRCRDGTAIKGRAMMKVRPLPTLAAACIALLGGSTLSQITAAGDAAKGKQTYLNNDCYT